MVIVIIIVVGRYWMQTLFAITSWSCLCFKILAKWNLSRICGINSVLSNSKILTQCIWIDIEVDVDLWKNEVYIVLKSLRKGRR